MSGEQCELCSASCDYPSCPATGPEAHVMLPAMRQEWRGCPTASVQHLAGIWGLVGIRHIDHS